MASTGMRTLLLNNGRRMPRVGLGTFLLKGEHGRETVERALKTGYRLLDTAYSYGNESDIGDAIQVSERDGVVKREELFITTKIGGRNLSPKVTRMCIEESRENLKTPYLDMLLIHSPWGLKSSDKDADGCYEYQLFDIKETWTAFEDAVKAGHVKSLGLSNCTEKQIRMILDHCKIRPQNLQFECHAYNQQAKLKEFCDMEQIVCTSYGSIGAPGRPPHHRSSDNVPDVLLDDVIVGEIAGKYNRKPTQILLRFLLQLGFAIIPKTSSFDRLDENFSLFDFQISEPDMAVLKGLDRGQRYFMFNPYRKHPDFPKKDEPF